MEQRIKCALPAPTDASDRLIDLVDRVMNRHPGKANPRRKLFSFLMRDCLLVRPSLDRPSQKIDRLVQSQLGTWIWKSQTGLLYALSRQLVACRSEFVTAEAAGGVRVFPLDGASIGGVSV